MPRRERERETRVCVRRVDARRVCIDVRVRGQRARKRATCNSEFMSAGRRSLSLSQATHTRAFEFRDESGNAALFNGESNDVSSGMLFRIFLSFIYVFLFFYWQSCCSFN